MYRMNVFLEVITDLKGIRKSRNKGRKLFEEKKQKESDIRAPITDH